MRWGWASILGKKETNVSIQPDLPNQFEQHIKLIKEIGANLPGAHLTFGESASNSSFMEATIAFPRRLSSAEVAQNFINGLCDRLNLQKIDDINLQNSALLPAPVTEIGNFVIYLNGGKNTDQLMSQLVQIHDWAGNCSPEISALIRDYESKSTERIRKSAAGPVR